MDYIVTKQIAVTADSPEEAVAKSGTEGKTISLNANLRPTPGQVPQRPTVTPALAKHPAVTPQPTPQT